MAGTDGAGSGGSGGPGGTGEPGGRLSLLGVRHHGPGSARAVGAALEAARIALTYRTPVFLLSDGYLANGSEPWRVPQQDELPDLRTQFATTPNHELADGTEVFWPYKRDPQTLARPWAVPGTPGLEHRIGGIEKADGSGNISYDPANHDHMVRTRQAKVDGIDVPDIRDGLGRQREWIETA